MRIKVISSKPVSYTRVLLYVFIARLPSLSSAPPTITPPRIVSGFRLIVFQYSDETTLTDYYACVAPHTTITNLSWRTQQSIPSPHTSPIIHKTTHQQQEHQQNNIHLFSKTHMFQPDDSSLSPLSYPSTPSTSKSWWWWWVSFKRERHHEDHPAATYRQKEMKRFVCTLLLSKKEEIEKVYFVLFSNTTTLL